MNIHRRGKVKILASSLKADPVISYLVSKKIWKLERDYYYKHGRYKIIVKKGFRFDLSSIPRFFWRIIAPFELSISAPLIHDILYRYDGKLPQDQVKPYKFYSRKEADLLFLQIMKEEGIVKWRRTIAYKAVRMFARRWK